MHQTGQASEAAIQGSTVVVSGSAGFLGSHLVDSLVLNHECFVVGLDSFAHAGDSARLTADLLTTGRYRIHTCDLSAPLSATLIRDIRHADVIVNLAAISNVDSSLRDPRGCVINNVNCVVTMLDVARELNPRAFVQISTDEVYGPMTDGERAVEWATIAPSNPYAASKAAQEAIAFSYWRSYGIRVSILNSMNVFGPRQDVGKYVPLIVSSILKDSVIPVHSFLGIPGARGYLHVSDWVTAVEHLIAWQLINDVNCGSRPPRFNLPGPFQVDNLSMVREVGSILDRPYRYELVEGGDMRPGHDRNYALETGKLSSLGWGASRDFQESLRETVEWYVRHPEWL